VASADDRCAEVDGGRPDALVRAEDGRCTVVSPSLPGTGLPDRYLARLRRPARSGHRCRLRRLLHRPEPLRHRLAARRRRHAFSVVLTARDRLRIRCVFHQEPFRVGFLPPGATARAQNRSARRKRQPARRGPMAKARPRRGDHLVRFSPRTIPRRFLAARRDCTCTESFCAQKTSAGAPRRPEDFFVPCGEAHRRAPPGVVDLAA
jgi:hypothetical protein